MDARMRERERVSASCGLCGRFEIHGQSDAVFEAMRTHRELAHPDVKPPKRRKHRKVR